MTTPLAEQTQAILDIGGPIPGDCWRTAVACLLEVDRDTVPHFVHEHGDDWWPATVAFVESARPGFTVVAVEPRFPIYENPEESPKRVILSGQSPRGDWLHAVIADAQTGELTHDPHPSQAGVTSHVDVMALTGR